ncbi:disease resistance protein Roq1-like [Gastrolobium bilobum]|uniref:disease resistance protein Roq1-like n=1 Tax=Gastrolobium bilobum TaxID=150636 RepID=UPI002AAFD76C|nr:disease resistance protein Roq1-like [Gastrolobium bilobum]
MMARQESLLSSSSFSYDVFLNFRGVDTRHGFTANLYKALDDRGIHTFIDNEELQKGEEITPSLVKAIEESRIAIIVLSTNYASSSFSLDELVHILHCIKQKGRSVLPVFYDVDPSDVRYQTGSYEEALATLEKWFKDDRLQKWREALRQTAGLCGFTFKQQGNRNEHELIEKIVKVVSNKINRAPLHVADYTVGLESKVQDVISLLNFGSDEVHMIGIHGFGGVGKTTLALSVFNSVAEYFEGLCFLQNVREISNTHGLLHLQETLLLKTVGKDIKFAGVNEGMATIEHRLKRRKILLVLDDVDKLKQLQATCGKPDWFGSGSRIIITTRDKDLLTSHEVKRTYEVDLLNNKEALELLCCYAFKTEKVDPQYGHILNRAVTYASGLPLALEVIGSDLFVRRKEEWESTLDQYEIIPNDEIQNILKVSFDSLKENQKKIFLDIACFFNGYALAYVKKILHAHHGFLPDDGIGVLIAKSLIKIDAYDHVTLHDLIEDMGKEIVRLEAPNEPSKRSRLWFHEDILQVLEENTESGVIQIMILDFPEFKVVEWDGNGFKDMKKLKTLIIRNAGFFEGPKHLPNSLRVLEWWGYPSTSLPSDFNQKNLAILELPQSPLLSIDSLMSKKRKFDSMKVLKFDGCQCITKIPDVSGVPNLEKLSFGHCDNLIKIHESVGFLNKLKILNASGCKKFSSFPPIELPSLEELNLSFCPSLENFPEILGKMEKITQLDITNTLIKELPFSIENLTRLQELVLNLCGGFVRLPRSISMMPELNLLIVMNCENFREIEGIPPNLKEFVVWKCTSLKDLDLTLFPECLTKLVLHNCENLQEIRGISPNIRILNARECTSLTSECTSMLLNQELHEEGGDKVFFLPGSSIPEWFEHRLVEESISFRFRNMIPSISVSFAFLFNGQYPTYYSLDIEVNGIPKVIKEDFNFYCEEGDYTVLYDIKPETFLRHDVLFLEENIWNYVKCTLSCNRDGGFLRESGIHVFKQGRSMEDIEFTDQQGLADSQTRQMILKRAARSLRLRSWEEHGCEIVSRKRKIGVLNVDLDNEAWEPCCPAPSKVALNSAVSNFATGAAREEGESSQNNLALLPLLEPQLGQVTEWLSLLPPPASNNYVNSHSNSMVSKLRSSAPNFHVFL